MFGFISVLINNYLNHPLLLSFGQNRISSSELLLGLEENITQDLVVDVEKIRESLGIGRWMLFGGSWGSTLALAYAVVHPERVRSLILRGVFLCSEREIHWFYEQDGAHQIFPDAWELKNALHLQKISAKLDFNLEMWRSRR